MVEFDLDKLKEQSDELVDNLKYYELYGKPIVDEYSAELDEKVQAIRNYINQIREYDLSFDVPSLQKICLDLSSTIYFTNDKLERLSLLEDMSNIKYKDKYNEAYTRRQGASTQENRKYTSEQLRSIAEQEALSERLINFIYTHAAKVLQGKIDSAYELLKSCSKSLSAEIQSMQTYGVGNKYQ